MRAIKPTARVLPRYMSTAAAATPPSTTLNPITSLLIANRGEIAVRIHRTASRLGIRTTTVYTPPDSASQHAALGLPSVALTSASGYLDGDALISVARTHGIQALHPGYGFLSENAGFAEKCAQAGIVFIGPPAQAITDMGDKARSKAIMEAAGVPCVPGYHGSEQAPGDLARHADNVGYPVLLKSVKGGGGKGMRIVRTKEEFLEQLSSARAEARASFGEGGEIMLVERYITRPRHVEVQVFADKFGNCVALGERDCSVQRRHQKILEESPAPDLSDVLRQDLWQKARMAASAVGYVGAGTVEFILDKDSGEFFFMEMNTRLQVEHPVSEMVTGTDLVEWQVRIAGGEKLPLTQGEIEERISQRGAAIEARIYAEKPEESFMPDSGKLVFLRTPEVSEDIRIDAGFVEGDTVSTAYDGMIAKLIVRGEDRTIAIRKMARALEEFKVVGLGTNVEFLKRLCAQREFIDGDVETGFIEKYGESLFKADSVPNEVFGQAALALWLEQAKLDRPHGVGFGFGQPSIGTRVFPLKVKDVREENPVEVTVTLEQKGQNEFKMTISRDGGNVIYEKVTSSLAPNTTSGELTTLFPHQRNMNTVHVDKESVSTTVTLFHQGIRYTLTLQPPKWVTSALGVTETAGSVVTPMPCKVLKVEVSEGASVSKGQRLVVVESMKMEMVIRAPKDGIVKRVCVEEGGICGGGVVLVEFEDE